MKERANILLTMDELMKEILQKELFGYESRMQTIAKQLEMLGQSEPAWERYDDEVIDPEGEGETLKEKLEVLHAYLQGIVEEKTLLEEEPLLEMVEEQEIIWPTTLTLWLEDMEHILGEIKEYLAA